MTHWIQGDRRLELDCRTTVQLPPATLAQYVRHAERFGTEFVFETARFELEPVEMGHLAKHLRRIDKRWSLSKEDREGLLVALIDGGVSDKNIREMVGVSQPTVRDRRTSLAEAAKANG